MKDEGTIAILVDTYVSIILLTVLGFASVGIAILASHRIQGVADFAVLYGHDRSVRAGTPDHSLLDSHVRNFLALSESADRIDLVEVKNWVTGDTSNTRICARYKDLFGFEMNSMIICREASAKSFLVF